MHESVRPRIERLPAPRQRLADDDASRAKAAIGEVHRILDAIGIRDTDAAYRASAGHVRMVAELARNALIAGASSADQKALTRGQ